MSIRPLAILLAACGSDPDPTAVSPTDTSADTGEVVAEPLRITSTTPADGASGVEPDASMVLVFSRSVASDSVSADSVRITVAGQPVPASRAVDDDRITLTPEADLPLLADVEVTVTPAVLATDGGAAEAAFEATFRVRDGVWDTVPSIFPQWIHQNGPYTLPVGNSQGEVVLPLHDLDQPLSFFDLDVVTYSPADATFSIDERVRTDQGAEPAFLRIVAGLSDRGHAAFVADTDDGVHVHMRGPTGWPDVDHSPLGTVGENFQIAVDNSGDVIAAWEDGGNIVSGRFDGSSWTSGLSLASGASGLWSLTSIEDEVLVLFEFEDGGLGSILRSGGAFGPTRRVGGLNADVNWVRVGRSAAGPTVTWEQDGTELRYATWDAATSAWTSAHLADGTRGAEVCRNADGLRIAVYRDDSGALARVAQPGRDFAVAEVLANAAGLEIARCFLDASGNGHGLWTSFGVPEIYWARFVDGRWGPAVPLGIETADVRGTFADPQGRLLLVFGTSSEVGALRFR